MKTFIKIALVLALGLSASSVMAFHDAGVAYCAGCHTMHNSQNGAVVDAANPNGNAYLLNAGNASDTCLKCHAAYGQFAGGAGFGAGGDFYWVTRTFTWAGRTAGTTVSSLSQTHGHNVISPTKGIVQDATLSSAPGGDFLSSRLACTSCHDPHGNENYRLLYGTELGPKYDGGRYDFSYAAPIAMGNGRRTITGSDGLETNSDHTIYQSGMSDWCANCHEFFHEDNTTKFVHPTRAMGSTIAATYNAYVSSDDLVSGDAATSYWGLVPFEVTNADSLADPLNYTQGPTGVDEVMCLTCHRAHASPFSDIARWDMSVNLISLSHPLATDIGFIQTDVDRKYYNYTFVANQRSLCNKCHTKDEFDGAPVANRRIPSPHGPLPHNSEGS